MQVNITFYALLTVVHQRSAWEKLRQTKHQHTFHLPGTQTLPAHLCSAALVVLHSSFCWFSCTFLTRSKEENFSRDVTVHNKIGFQYGEARLTSGRAVLRHAFPLPHTSETTVLHEIVSVGLCPASGGQLIRTCCKNTEGIGYHGRAASGSPGLRTFSCTLV